MRIGMSADWHADNMKRTYFIKDVLNRQLDMDAQVKTMIRICKEQQVSHFFILGDLFETSYVKGYHFARVVAYLRAFVDRGIRVIILPGNHEITEIGNSVMPAISALKHKDIEVWDKAGMYTLGNINVLALPHERREVFKEYSTYTEYVTALKEEYAGEYDIVVGHFQPTNAYVPMRSEMFIGSSRLLNTSIFPKNVPIYCGHVHTPQDIANTCIIGSPVKQFLGEAEEQKRFVIYDTKEKGHESYNLNCQPMKRYVVDFTETDAFPNVDSSFRGCMVGVDITAKTGTVVASRQALQKLFDTVDARIIVFRIHRVHAEARSVRAKKESMSPRSLFARMVFLSVKAKGVAARLVKLGTHILDRCEENDQGD